MVNVITKALLAGLGISIISGPIGSLMIWQRMAYFGDTLAHASLFGICIAAILNINIYYGLVTICLLIAVILTMMSKNKKITNDTTLSILSHSIFAAGLIIASLFHNIQIDLISYLCGDILSITNKDLIWIFIVDLIVIASLFCWWDKLVFITISKELAIANNIPQKTIQWIFVLLVSLIFAVSIRLIGVLLINALLIIPCITAKIWAKEPTHMAFGGSICSFLSIFLGILGSFWWDVPTGPSIVVGASILLILSILINYIVKRLKIINIGKKR